MNPELANKIQCQGFPTHSAPTEENRKVKENRGASGIVNRGAAGSALDESEISNGRMKKKKKRMGKGDGSGKGAYTMVAADSGICES